jgi:vacuolar-type H+-ATPase subunit B/Vma2
VGTIFENWTDQLAELFVAGGMSEDTAHRMATLTITATEGAVVLSRAQRNRQPFDEVASTLLDLVPDVT